MERKRIKEQLKIGLDENHKIEIVNSTDKEKTRIRKTFIQELQRRSIERDVDRLFRNDRIAEIVSCM